MFLYTIFKYMYKHCLGLQRSFHISATKCPLMMGLDQNLAFKRASNLYRKIKLNIADM